MIISVAELKARCLEIIRQVEYERKVIEIVRRGAVVARLLPAGAFPRERKPWQRLRGSGELSGAPDQSLPAPRRRSPFDVEGVDLGLQREKILKAIHDSRRK
jgi:prevent-host-death family protein